VRDAVHEFANDIVKSFTGAAGRVSARASPCDVGKGSHEIAVVDMDARARRS